MGVKEEQHVVQQDEACEVLSEGCAVQSEEMGVTLQQHIIQQGLAVSQQSDLAEASDLSSKQQLVGLQRENNEDDLGKGNVKNFRLLDCEIV